MARLENTTCCGIQELSGVSGDFPEDCLVIASRAVGAYILFSDVADNYDGGPALAKLIRKHDLGTLSSPPSKVNPNSGNRLRAWLWGVNKRKLVAFVRKLDR